MSFTGLSCEIKVQDRDFQTFRQHYCLYILLLLINNEKDIIKKFIQTAFEL